MLIVANSGSACGFCPADRVGRSRGGDSGELGVSGMREQPGALHVGVHAFVAGEVGQFSTNFMGTAFLLAGFLLDAFFPAYLIFLISALTEFLVILNLSDFSFYVI